MLLNILAVGDIVGEGGQDILARRLRELQREQDIHFTVVNGENASGVGLTPRQARDLYDAGADVITLGNHTWNRIQIADFLDKDPYILRPANYAGRVPGRGFGVYDGPKGLKIGVMNLMGRLELNSNLDSPFKAANQILRSHEAQQCQVMLLDFHAEATSEKGLVSGRTHPRPVGHPHPRAHRRHPDFAQGHRLCHRPGYDGTETLRAGHPPRALHQPVFGRSAPALRGGGGALQDQRLPLYH